MEKKINKETETSYGLISVPLDLLSETGIEPDKVIQMYADDGKLIVEPLSEDDFKCDGECEDCVFFDDCPYAEDNDTAALFSFLDGLTETEQKNACIYLTEKFGEVKSNG